MTAAEQDYRGVEKLIRKLVHDFHYRHGGDLLELESTANLAFWQAYLSYDPSKAKLTTWCQWKVWKALLSHLRTTIKEQGRFPLDTDALLEEIPQRQRIHSRELVKDLSNDAQTIANLLLDTPYDLRCLVAEIGKGTTENFHTAIARLLRRMGWAWCRILDASHEITEALTS